MPEAIGCVKRGQRAWIWVCSLPGVRQESVTRARPYGSGIHRARRTETRGMRARCYLSGTTLGLGHRSPGTPPLKAYYSRVRANPATRAQCRKEATGRAAQLGWSRNGTIVRSFQPGSSILGDETALVLRHAPGQCSRHSDLPVDRNGPYKRAFGSSWRTPERHLTCFRAMSNVHI